MIPGVAVEPAAIRDAEEIYAFLAKDNLPVARRFNEAVADTSIAVRDDPKLGIAWHSPSGAATGLRWKRIQGFKSYLLFYRSEAGGIIIVRILHGSRDIEAILSE